MVKHTKFAFQKYSYAIWTIIVSNRKMIIIIILRFETLTFWFTYKICTSVTLWQANHAVSWQECQCITLFFKILQQVLNPISHDSDQDQFSCNNILMLPREIVTGVNKIVT